jgi:hypothetical protein
MLKIIFDFKTNVFYERNILEVGVEDSIVNAPSSVRRVETQTTQKLRLDLNSSSVMLILRINLNEHPIIYTST